MITRFAPSPTGPLHLGHAYSAMLAHDMALAAGGTFLLRIEDIDQTRARAEWESQIYDDLAWLGLTWETPVWRQSEHLETYRTALENLWSQGLLYACTCNRRDIQAAASAPQEGAPLIGPDGIIYPGTCRGRNTGTMPTETALRLDLDAVPQALSPFVFNDPLSGDYSVTLDNMITDVGDVVLGRKDSGTSYHLSVVLDDAAQGITDVVRGKDLYVATQIHIVLHKLLGLPSPIYHHHKLIRDDDGKRLAKRDDARALSKFRAEGATPQDIRRMVGLL